jgi:hypothetical protein
MNTQKVHTSKSKIIKINKQDELEDLNALSDALENSVKFAKSNKKYIVSENDESMPKNYGQRWSDQDKNELLKLIKDYSKKEIDFVELGNKLGRTEGGVKGELRKIILQKYLSGIDCETISENLSIQYKFIKMLVKSYIETEAETDINNLERENKLLKLKMENMELRAKISQKVMTKL